MARRDPDVGSHVPRLEDLQAGADLLSEGSRSSGTTATMGLIVVLPQGRFDLVPDSPVHGRTDVVEAEEIARAHVLTAEPAATGDGARCSSIHACSINEIVLSVATPGDVLAPDPADRTRSSNPSHRKRCSSSNASELSRMNREAHAEAHLRTIDSGT